MSEGQPPDLSTFGEYLTVAEIASVMRVSKMTVYQKPRELHQTGAVRVTCRISGIVNSPEGATRCCVAGGVVVRRARPMHDPPVKRVMFCVRGDTLAQRDLAGAARLELVSGAVQLHPEDAMFEAMLRGWRAQQAARGLREKTIASREALARRFGVFTGEYPWNWSAADVDQWSAALAGEDHLERSTIRDYQGGLRLFTEFLTDARYGWVPACQERFGTHPVPVCHEWNTIAHLNDYEGRPEARPFTREELQRFFDYADEQVDRAVRAKRKGALAAYRDATLLKVLYGWGLRRTECSRLDMADWGRNAAAPQFGRFGMLHVRYGKAKRGQPPRRRNVASVMAWAVEAVTDYAENIRPRFGCADHPALWVTERGGRIKPAEINARFAAYRDALALPEELSPHALRHFLSA